MDILFRSAAEHAGDQAVAVLLTGMGVDGARGLRSLRAAGARTLAEDEESCVVFGMPQAAINWGLRRTSYPSRACPEPYSRLSPKLGRK